MNLIHLEDKEEYQRLWHKVALFMLDRVLISSVPGVKFLPFFCILNQRNRVF
jgi:hypothetical protein